MNHIDLKNKTIFVTGSAGFIGSNLVLELLKTQSPINIIGLDNMNDYYDVSIKEYHLNQIKNGVYKKSKNVYPSILTLLMFSIKMILLTKQLSTKSLPNINRILL